MKTKSILSIVFGLLLSATASGMLASATGNDVAGFGLFAIGIISMFVTPLMGAGVAFAIVNPATITWNGKDVMEMTEAVMESTYNNPAITDIHQVIPNIVAKQQIVFLGRLSKITKKKTTCGGSAGTHTISMSEKFWDPARTEFWLSECADSLEESFWVWGLNKGIQRKDLTDTDFAEFVMSRIEDAMLEDILRIVWFNDTTHADVDDSPAGVLTSGTDLTDYNIIDGLWAQIYDVVAGDATRRVTISKNSQVTYANQAFNSTDTTNKVAIGILQDLVDNADDRLKEKENKVIYLTGSLYDQYKKELKSYTSLESAFEILQSGKKVLTFDGIQLVPMRFWDRTIKADFDNGSAYYQPHRAVLTVKENIPVGVDGTEAMKSMEQWYERKDQTSNWRGGYKIDTKVLEDYLIQVAY